MVVRATLTPRWTDVWFAVPAAVTVGVPDLERDRPAESYQSVRLGRSAPVCVAWCAVSGRADRCERRLFQDSTRPAPVLPGVETSLFPGSTSSRATDGSAFARLAPSQGGRMTRASSKPTFARRAMRFARARSSRTSIARRTRTGSMRACSCWMGPSRSSSARSASPMDRAIPAASPPGPCTRSTRTPTACATSPVGARCRTRPPLDRSGAAARRPGTWPPWQAAGLGVQALPCVGRAAVTAWERLVVWVPVEAVGPLADVGRGPLEARWRSRASVLGRRCPMLFRNGGAIRHRWEGDMDLKHFKVCWRRIVNPEDICQRLPVDRPAGATSTRLRSYGIPRSGTSTSGSSTRI